MPPSDRPTEPRQPQGTVGDGQDAYPTYHDRPGDALGSAPGTRPTDTNLPRSKRASASPMLIGVLAFAAIVVVYIVWSLINMASVTDEAMQPGDAATPPAASSAPAVSGTAVDSNETSSSAEPALDRNVQPQGGSPAPAQTETTPGAADVPGGATGTAPGNATTP